MIGERTLLTQVIRKVSACFFISIIGWIALLVLGSHSMKAMPEAVAYHVTFGPLTLNHIVKYPLGDSVAVQFSFKSGLLWYFVFWSIVGLVLGIAGYWKRKGPFTNKTSLKIP